MKILHYAQMMRSLGHEVIHYGVEGASAPCELVSIIRQQEQKQWFGEYKPDSLYNVDWSPQAPYWRILNERAVEQIKKRKQKGDFVCVIHGSLAKPLADAVGNDVMTVEYGIGYNGTFSPYRVFESYAHRHKIYGAEGGFDPDGKFYDAVIPNYLNPDDYPFKAEKQDYFLYLGRLIKRKGIDIAVETCKQIGARLVVAGQGCKEFQRTPGEYTGRLICEDGGVYDNVEYVGFATGQKRADLFGNAKGVFVPTKYLEPFGAVAIEAQMAGTPAITTDFGAFTETVEHGKTGFRCSTLNEFVYAAKSIDSPDPQYIHDRAVKLYGMDNVRWQYQTYFERLYDLWHGGWYSLHDKADERWLRGYT
jgi:glycosyltransferase involved in cell wall biosynthesis